MPTADELLGPAVATALVACLRRAAPVEPFDATAETAGGLAGLGLSERVFALRDGLLTDVGGELDRLEPIVATALDDGAFDGWMTWPVGEAVATAAVALAAGEPGSAADAALDRGLDLLRDLTPRLTSEFAIRTLLLHDLDGCLVRIASWTDHPDPAVRRLASEGTRPRLPWAKRVPEIVARPGAAVPVLDALYRDEDEVVRRSVANHVNDVSRIDPALAVELCARWSAAPDDHTPRLVRHALRTLVKAADPAALALLGFGSADDLEVVGPTLDRRVVAGAGDLDFTVAVTNRGAEPVQVAVDYVVHFRKASGALAPKVFKITTCNLAPGERAQFTRTRSFKPLTTRRYHLGEHVIEVQVNGRRFGRTTFDLTN